MIDLFKNLWSKEPARLISIVTAGIVAAAGAWADAPSWVAIVVAAIVVVSGEITRSQVSPSR